MTIRVLTLLFVLSLPSLASGQNPDVQQLDAMIAEARESWEVPGMSVAIVKDGKVVLAKGYGVREAGRPDVTDGDTLFAIASNTKAFASAAIAMLAEDGKLDWHDRVRDHLDYFELYDPYVSAEMRIDDLLCHRSGLGTFSGDLLWYGTRYSPEEVVRRTRHLPPTGSFRAHYGYSNLMFLAAGEVVVKASGQSWPEFVRARILEPLDMIRTATSVRQLESLDNVATPHKTTLEGSIPIEWNNWDTMVSAGGIISSANDMAKWITVQLNRGRVNDDARLFTESSSHRMWSPHTIIPIDESSQRQVPTTHFRAYGLGWSLADYQGRKTVGHGGGYDGMYSRVLMVPEEQLGVVVLTNSMTGISTAVANQIVDAYLEAEPHDWIGEGLRQDRRGRREFYDRIAKAVEQRVDGTDPTQPLDAYAGTYSGKLYGDATVRLEQDQLVLRLLPNPDLVAELTHLHYDTFVIRWRQTSAWFAEGTAQFVLNATGDIVELKLDVPNDDFWFTELKLKKANHPRRDLRQ